MIATQQRGKPKGPAITLGLCLFVWVGYALRVCGQVDWPTLGYREVVTNVFSAPTCIVHAGDGSQRLFIVEQDGRIRIIQSNAVPAQSFLDITGRVLRGAEQGLLGLAFPPGTPPHDHFYVNYTRGGDGATVVARFNVSSDLNVADSNSEQIIKIIPQPYANHNGGQLAFGPDGYLYVGMGDGGFDSNGIGDPQTNAQNRATLLGKLLRIDVESGVTPYSIPGSNPFVGDTNYAPEIWAMGLRNPWRFSFDRLTGDLYIGDVGHGRYEEIDFQAAGSPGGQNYGWPYLEGGVSYRMPAGYDPSGLAAPATYYPRGAGDFGNAVTGGYVYRGPSQTRMDGLYFFGDFMSTRMWALRRDGTNWQSCQFPRSGFSVSTLGEDEQGRLYLAQYNAGRIYQIEDSQQSWPPEFYPTNKATLSSNVVVVTCPTPGATIRYTTNGSVPTDTDPGVPSGGMIPLTQGTNRIRAFRSDLNPSLVTTGVFTLKVATPVFNPAQGPISNGTIIAISTVTTGATIYYTTNGTIPTTASLRYSNGAVMIGNRALNAFAAANGYSNSSVQTVTYLLAQVATPQFSPSAGPITNGTQLSMSCGTPGAVIRYTLNGTSPTTNSPIYSSPITLTNPTTVQARAYLENWKESGIQQGFYYFKLMENTVVTTFAGTSIPGLSNGVRSLAQFNYPQGICLDTNGNFYVADTGNNVIRKILPSGEVTTFAGSGTGGYQDGFGTNAQFTGPNDICTDKRGNFYVSDSCYHVRKIIDAGMVTTLAVVGSCGGAPVLWGISADAATNVYVGKNTLVIRVLPNGTFSTAADIGSWWVGVSIDSRTNLFASADTRVWKIESNGQPVLFAGRNEAGYSDGPGLSAFFSGIQRITFDSNTNMFVSDTIRVRRIAADGTVTTFAGDGTQGYRNGAGSAARFDFACGLCVDAAGNVYVTDPSNNCIRKISPDSAGIGIADDWQLAHFGRLGIDPNGDEDNDGMNNYAEFWAGTDPLDSDSKLAIQHIDILNNGDAQIRCQTVSGKSYILLSSSDLKVWSSVGSSVFGDGSVIAITDSQPVNQNQARFYRISVIP